MVLSFQFPNRQPAGAIARSYLINTFKSFDGCELCKLA